MRIPTTESLLGPSAKVFCSLLAFSFHTEFKVYLNDMSYSFTKLSDNKKENPFLFKHIFKFISKLFYCVIRDWYFIIIFLFTSPSPNIGEQKNTNPFYQKVHFLILELLRAHFLENDSRNVIPIQTTMTRIVQKMMLVILTIPKRKRVIKTVLKVTKA